MVNEHGESEGSIGLTVGDYNNDGWLDLFVTNGHTDGRLELSFRSDTYAEPNYVLRNESGSLFVDVSDHTGLRAMKVRVGRGTAFADFDNDGDVDVLLVNKNDRPAFLLNDGGNRRNWLARRTQGGTGNRDGIGAKAVVTAEGQRRFFEVRGSDSYLSSNDMRIHVGLGESTSANVTIRWASGVEDRHEGVAAGSFNRAAEGQELEETLTPGSGVERQ